MGILLAFGAAIATSLTNIFTKIGIGEEVDSKFATAYKTLIVIFFSIVICLISGAIYKFNEFTCENYLYLSLSGIFTGCSWIFYNRALQLGNVNKVAPIDKSSFILTNILFIIFFFDDTTKNGNWLKILLIGFSSILMLTGTILMIAKKKVDNVPESKKWIIYAVLSAISASFVALFVKLGIKNTPSELGTLYRTLVVFVFASIIAIFSSGYKCVKTINKKSWAFLTLAGIATGVAWLLEYSALNIVDNNPIAVTSIEKFSILLTMLFSFLVLKEKFTKRMLIGLALLTAGIIVAIFI